MLQFFFPLILQLFISLFGISYNKMYQYPLKFTVFITTAAYAYTTGEKNINTSDFLKRVKANIHLKSLLKIEDRR